MAMQMIATPSMRAHAEVLVERSSRWARGFDHMTGHRFVMFVSSRTDKDGKPIYHKTRADGLGCTCESWLYRSACSHALACQWDTERQAFDKESDELFAGFEKFEVEAAPALPAAAPVARKPYAALFPENDDVF